MAHKAKQTLGPPPDWMIIDAVRYATGRMTYQVGITVDWVLANWKHLSAHAKAIIKQDLETEFEQDDRAREAISAGRPSWHPLGHDCDRAQWERLRALYSDAGCPACSVIEAVITKAKRRCK